MRKINTMILVSVIFVIFILSSCTSTDDTTTPNTSHEEVDTVAISEFTQITAEEAKEMMDNEEVIVLDVRELSEYNSGHIPGAILLPVGNIETEAESVLPDKSATLLVYCRSGNRSQVASNALLRLGYTNVYDFGGIIDWPYEITTED